MIIIIITIKINNNNNNSTCIHNEIASLFFTFSNWYFLLEKFVFNQFLIKMYYYFEPKLKSNIYTVDNYLNIEVNNSRAYYY